MDVSTIPTDLFRTDLLIESYREIGMQFIANLLLAALGVYVFFSTLGFWWGLGFIALFALNAIAKSGK